MIEHLISRRRQLGDRPWCTCSREPNDNEGALAPATGRGRWGRPIGIAPFVALALMLGGMIWFGPSAVLASPGVFWAVLGVALIAVGLIVRRFR
jgi:hypothetical protein